jgi:hypothetical protein
MQCLHNPDQTNLDNVNNIRHETSRYFRDKRRNARNLILMNLTLTVRTRMSETCVGVSVTLRRVTRLDNIKMDLQEVGWGAWTGFIWLGIGKGGGHL